MPPTPLTLRFAEGIHTVSQTEAPSPGALWAVLQKSATPAVLFDFDTARGTHSNTAMQRLLDQRRSELWGCTGRMLTPERFGVVADVISARLHAHGRYSGPVVLRRGEEPLPLHIDIPIFTHHGYRYGLNLYTPARSTPATTPKLLIVEDNRLVLRAMSRLCRRLMPLVTAANAAEAIKLLACDPDISVILSDIDMPGLSGVQLLRLCQLFRPDLADRFILYSGRCVPTDLPGVPFLSKPVPIGLLQKTIADVLER